MVVDFDIIKKVVDRYDHHDLNEFFEPTTAENFCNQLWDDLERGVLVPLNEGSDPKNQVRLDEISVYETERNKATLGRFR